METTGNNVPCVSEYYQDVFDQHLVDARPEEYYEDFLDQHLRTMELQLQKQHNPDTFREEINNVVNDIWTDLGSGHSERVYHNAFEVSLRELNIPYE